MSDTDIVVDVSFLQYGMHAPSNSAFAGILTTGSLFGGFFEYTARDEAINGDKNSEGKQNEDDFSYTEESSSGSLLDYTSRDYATLGSSESQYFTMSSEGKLFTEEDRIRFRKQWSASFSQKGDLAWTVVVSLDNYSLLNKYGLHDQSDFAQITTVALNRAFQKIFRDPGNMVWWQDYHTNTSHPHIHVTFLEKQNTRSRGKLTAKEMKCLKTAFITEIAARQMYYQKYNMTSDEALENLQSMKTDIISKTKEIPFQTIDKITNLYTQIPEKGRLQYNSTHMIPYRQQLDEIVDLLLKHETVKDTYSEFLGEISKLANNLNSLGKEDISTLMESQDKKLRIQIANAVLKEFKNFADNSKIKRIREWKQYKGDELIKDLNNENNDDDLYIWLPAPDSEEELFAQGADLLTNFQNHDERNEGMLMIYRAAKQGDPKAKKYMNFMKKSYGMDKKTYHATQETLSGRLIPVIIRGIKEKQNSIDDEISDYLYGNDINTSGSKSVQSEVETLQTMS